MASTYGLVGFLPGDASDEGAFPLRARIWKCEAEEGDAHPVGTEGRVLASHAIPEDALRAVQAENPQIRDVEFFYFVEWDSAPGVPVGVADWKIELVM